MIYRTVPLREGILYDLALVMCNETLFPVAKMQVLITPIVMMIIVNMIQVSKSLQFHHNKKTQQTMLAELNSRVRRKLLVLDCRATHGRKVQR